MQRWLWVWLVSAGCYQPSLNEACNVRCGPDEACPSGLTCTAGLCTGAGGACGPVAPDAEPAPDGADEVCLGQDGNRPFMRICATPAQDPLVYTSPAFIDTTDCVVTPQPDGGPSVCVIAVPAITIASTLTILGPHPVVLFATQAISVDTGGIIDVASRRTDPRAGAGSNPAGCPTSISGKPPAIAGAGGGGGAGGSLRYTFAGSGGGASGAGGAATIQGGLNFYGGCDGGAGGGNGSALGAAGGRGGGAVYLLAGAEISIAGTIDASGSGTGGTPVLAGGAGGGSGGMILLDAPMVVVKDAGRLYALGGGGGAGGGDSTAGTGGGDPIPPAAGDGPAGVDSGGYGGDGAGIGFPMNGQSIKTDAGGGGGGGGGPGVIYIINTPGLLIQPAAVVIPAHR